MTQSHLDIPSPQTSAVFGGKDREYRYSLSRSWRDFGLQALWVMLNPSIADETRNDRTLDKITAFTKSWNFGRLTVVNLYALVSTDPAELFRHEDPVGPENDAAIACAAKTADLIVLGWGAKAPHPKFPDRARQVSEILLANMRSPYKLHCLGYTKDGLPRHPLYLPLSTPVETFYG